MSGGVSLRKSPKAIERALGVYFATVNLTSAKGRTLRVVSDGRSGDGFTHWRAVYIGGRLVASLASSGRYHEVTIAKRGNLRGVQGEEFVTLGVAVRALCAAF